jgi:DNA-damage-inducible protein J
MVVSSKMIHVSVDSQTKEQAAETLAHMGLSFADAVRLFLKRVVIEQALPLELKVPNAETQAAIAESRAIMRARFATTETLLNDLDNGQNK